MWARGPSSHLRPHDSRTHNVQEVGERTDKVRADTAALARQLTDRDRLLEELGRRVLAMTEDAG